MIRKVAFASLTGLVVFVLAISLASTVVAENQKKELYSATAVGTSGSIGGQSVRVDIHISEFTTDEEAKELAELLAEGGQDALRRKLEKIDKGQIGPTGRVGNDIAIARAFPKGSGKIIRLVTARVMPFVELYWGGRSRDYDLAMIELEVDENGEGQGRVIAAAKVKIDDSHQIEVESLGLQPVKLMGVRRWD